MEKQSLQKQVLKLSEENIELTFQLEQLKKTVPRLKVQPRCLRVISVTFFSVSMSLCSVLVSCVVNVIPLL